MDLVPPKTGDSRTVIFLQIILRKCPHHNYSFVIRIKLASASTIYVTFHRLCTHSSHDLSSLLLVRFIFFLDCNSRWLPAVWPKLEANTFLMVLILYSALCILVFTDAKTSIWSYQYFKMTWLIFELGIESASGTY